MARLARIVIPGLPHHVTQRGNHRAPIFFGDDDYALYRDLLAERARQAKVEIWAWCLMPNHVHLIAVPKTEDGLRRAIAETHRRYAAYINARARRTGHLFQARFGSTVMDDAHLMAAIAYVSLNPLRAGLVKRAQNWPWSSVGAHLTGKDDGLTAIAPVKTLIPRFADILETPPGDELLRELRQAETTGRPAGSEAFQKKLERRLGRPVLPRKRGRKPGTRVNRTKGKQSGAESKK
jgi:putative transposase